MARSLTKPLLCAVLFVAAGAATGVEAWAENLPDPTKPPAGYASGGPVAESGPVLQTVLISATRRVAIISGKTVRVGDKFGDAQVMSIAESEVVLKNGKSMEVLRLYPALKKPALENNAGKGVGNSIKGN